MTGSWAARLMLSGLLLSISVAAWGQAGARMSIVADGRPKAVILLGRQATGVERKAAKELQKYIKAMTGADIPVAVEGQQAASQNVILVGRWDTHAAIKGLCDAGLISLSADAPGLDGFIIRTVRLGDTNYLVLGGSMDRGTLYAVYHLLEVVFHVGFFEDGEYIPKYTDLTVPPLDIAERPAFRIRHYMQMCCNAYSSQFWSYPEWKYECDFAAKKKQNFLMIDIPHTVKCYLKRMVESTYGVDPKDSYSPLDSHPQDDATQWDIELLRKLHSYVRNDLGLMVVGPTWGAEPDVSAAFRAANPNLRYVETLDYQENPISTWLDPNSDEFVDYMVKYLMAYNALFGTDHYYFISPIGTESHKMMQDPERNKTIRADFARGIVKGLKKVDPQAIFFASGWAFYFGAWPTYYVKQFCDAIPDDSFLTTDMWAEAFSDYKLHNYFFGKDWLLGVVHSFGGYEFLFGDMKHTIEMFRDVLDDPMADRCVGTCIQPEIIVHNPLYWDLLLNVTWNPRRVDVDRHLRDFALRRYGRLSARRLYGAMERLYESVYGKTTFVHGAYPPRPLYRTNLYDLDAIREPYLERAAYIPKLREATEIMLQEAANQEDNPLYNNDLVDICKQYVAELINYYTIALYDAFKAGEKEKFEVAAQRISICFDNLALILSSNPRFWLETEIGQCMKRSQESGREIIEEGDTLYLKAARARRRRANPQTWEYVSVDRLELVEHYYRNKMETYIGALREKLDRGDRSISESDVLGRYTEVAEEYWANDSYNLTEADKYEGTVAQAAAKVLVNLGSIPEPEPIARIPTPIFDNSDFEQGTENWSTTGNAWTPWGRKDIGVIGTCAMGGARLDPALDAGTGVLQSVTFTIAEDVIEFLVAGFDADEAEKPTTRHDGRNRVELVDAVTGEVLRKAEEPGDYFFAPVRWSVSDLRGRDVFIRAIDDNTSHWGWLAVDDFNYVEREGCDP